MNAFIVTLCVISFDLPPETSFSLGTLVSIEAKIIPTNEDFIVS